MWVKIHRDILESQVFASQTTLKIWIWLLLKAKYKDCFVSLKTGQGEQSIKIKRGQLLFGRFKAEKETGINGSTIYKHIQKLEQWGNILIESNNQYSLITIVKYNDYQNVEEKSNNHVTTAEQLRNNYVTSTEQLRNTYKESIEGEEGKESKEENKRLAAVSLHAKMIDFFMKVYLQLNETPYQFTAKDGNNMSGLLKKIKGSVKMTHTDADEKQIEELAATTFGIILKFTSEDDYYRDKITIPFLNSQYNEIVTKIKQKSNGTPKSKSAYDSAEKYRN